MVSDISVKNGSGNGLSPSRHQILTQTDANLL